MFELVLFSIAAFVGSASSLRLSDASEGSCHGARFKPMPVTDLSFIENFKYCPAASRHNYYAMASGHPNFRQMREFELYYNLCITQNATGPSAHGSSFGFGGRLLGTYSFAPKANKPGVVNTIQHSIDDGEDPAGEGTQTITLTDYKTFIFLANCWRWARSPEERSWEVLSLTPNLSDSTKQLIEDHAVSLGFDRENVVFLSYDRCNLDTESEEVVGRSLPSNRGNRSNNNNRRRQKINPSSSGRGGSLVGKVPFNPEDSGWAA